MKLSLLLTTALLCFSAPAFADVMLENVHAFETSEGMKNGAVLLTIVNHDKTADKLIGASTPDAAKVEIHQMSETNGVMQMRPIGGVAVPAGETVTLDPNGYHIMLLGLKAPLKAGSAHTITLQFQRAGKVKTTFEVQSRAVPQKHDMSHMDMGH